MPLLLALACTVASETPSARQPADPDKRATTPEAPVQALSSGAALEDERNTIAVFQAAGPATVFVTQLQTQVVRARFALRALEVPAGSGTGFLWDDQGHVVTNYHVVAGGDGYTVTLHDQTAFEAVLVGGEPRRDIAVLKLIEPPAGLTPIALPRPDAILAVGQKALAIGNPFGLDHTLTTGVISALGREVAGYGGGTIPDMIQTDASINPGNSGGPLLNSSGELIGMNTMIYSQSGQSAGIGFAVPVSVIRRLVPQIVATGRVQTVGLGIEVDDNLARRNRIRGALIRSVREGTPAAEAGMIGLRQTPRGWLLGDVIVGIDDTQISNFDDLYNALEGREAGDEVKVTYIRGEEQVTVSMKVAVIEPVTRPPR